MITTIDFGCSDMASLKVEYLHSTNGRRLEEVAQYQVYNVMLIQCVLYNIINIQNYLTSDAVTATEGTFCRGVI